MRLYYSPGSCSLAPHIVCRELDFPVELERVRLATKKTASGEDFDKLNPKGYVPALRLDGGAVLTEGPAIVQYLADLRPEAGLVPAPGTLERYDLQAWLNFTGTELHKLYSSLFDSEAPEEWKARLRKRLSARIDFVAQHLNKEPYLLGASFTVADAYLYTVLRWSRFVGLELGLWPALIAYCDRVAARPGVQAALRAEGLTSNRT